MNPNATQPESIATDSTPILVRPADPCSRVQPESGYYEGTNLRGELRLRAALPVSWHL